MRVGTLITVLAVHFVPAFYCNTNYYDRRMENVPCKCLIPNKKHVLTAARCVNRGKSCCCYIAYGLACASRLEHDFHDIKYTRHPNWRLLPSGTCGKRVNFSKPLDARVINGKDAELGQHPWIAELIIEGNERHFCGSSVINERYILTAAHCFGLNVRLKVRLGENTRSTRVDCTADKRRCAPRAVVVGIEEVFIHKNYGRVHTYPNNDIALVRLKQPIKFNEYIRPICLPTYPRDEMSLDDSDLDSAGWGMTVPFLYTSDSDKLQTVKVPLVPLKKCKEICDNYLGKEDCRGYVDKNKICAGKIAGKGVCHGDSGGPLMKTAPVHRRGHITFLVGIVSGGQPGCGAPVPDQYTRVSSFVHWVLDNIRE